MHQRMQACGRRMLSAARARALQPSAACRAPLRARRAPAARAASLFSESAGRALASGKAELRLGRMAGVEAELVVSFIGEDEDDDGR